MLKMNNDLYIILTCNDQYGADCEIVKATFNRKIAEDCFNSIPYIYDGYPTYKVLKVTKIT